MAVNIGMQVIQQLSSRDVYAQYEGEADGLLSTTTTDEPGRWVA
jgi:hypothetical protein